jgi:hypothetical protein
MRVFFNLSLLLVATNFALLTVSAPALAEPHPQIPPNTNRLSVDLKAPPDLPYLPAYSGKTRNYRALDYPRPTGGGRFVTVAYDCMEHPGDVAGFYKSAFQQYGWSVAKRSTDKAIYADRGKLHCSVTFRHLAGNRLSNVRERYTTGVFVTYRAYN